MSFVTEDEVLSTVEPVLAGVFEEFAKGREVTPTPFPRIPYKTSILEYGSDKPDLRNPLKIVDVSDAFRGSDFRLFAQSVEKGSVVRAIPAPGGGAQPRSWFDKLNDWARREGAAGLGYIIFENGAGKVPLRAISTMTVSNKSGKQPDLPTATRSFSPATPPMTPPLWQVGFARKWAKTLG